MKRAAVAAAAFVAFLASTRAADAAATVRVDVFPDRPRVGEVATVQLRPFWLLEGTPPALLPEGATWSVAAISPSGRRLRIRMLRKRSDPYLWSGSVRFPLRGPWIVCVPNFSSTGRACIPRSPGWQRLQVRPRKARIDVWQRLERPFHITTMAAADRCPTTARDSKGDLTRIGSLGTAWGDGPAYPGLGNGAEPVLRYLDPIPPGSDFYGGKWFGQKVLWMVDPVYRGPVLVRGRQLDGPNELRFDRGLFPPRQMRILPSSFPRRGRASYTRMRAPGCYGYQVDGLSFSYVIVFEATPATAHFTR